MVSRTVDISVPWRSQEEQSRTHYRDSRFLSNFYIHLLCVNSKMAVSGWKLKSNILLWSWFCNQNTDSNLVLGKSNQWVIGWDGVIHKMSWRMNSTLFLGGQPHILPIFYTYSSNVHLTFVTSHHFQQPPILVITSHDQLRRPPPATTSDS